LVTCKKATGSGSKPSWQWRDSTPITSVVPDSVRKAVVNSRGKTRLIPFGRVSSHAQPGHRLKLRREAGEQE
jgi:hypothetical protein